MLLNPQILTRSRKFFSSAYVAQGVHFDGADTYLSRGAGLGQADSKVGIISYWIKAGADADAHQLFITSGSFIGASRKNAGGLNYIDISGNFGSDLNIRSTSAVVSTDGWVHVLVSWNLATGVGKLYRNDLDSTDLTAAVNTDLLHSTIGDVGIGGDWAGGGLSAFDVADLYINLDASLDLTNSANRRKFISAGGSPVNLGSDGSIPTGTAPVMYFSGPVGSWHINKGSGGGFTSHGTGLTAVTGPV